MLQTLNQQQQHRRAESSPKSTTTFASSNNSIIDSDAVSNKVNEWIGSFSTWTSSVQKSLENTFKQDETTTATTTTLPTTNKSKKAPPSSSVVTSTTTTNNNDFVNIDLSSSSAVMINNNTLKKSQPTTQSLQPASTTASSPTQNKMMEKRSLIRNQDFSSGEEDEESLIGSLKKGSSFLKASTAGSWFDSTFSNIKTQLFSENNKPTEEDDGPLAKSFSSKTSSTKSPSPVSSTQNNLLDSLSSTFSSLKTQTNDKWSSLTSQFFETQPPIDENDNSFIGRLSKDVDGMVTLSAKQRMYGFFMALGFGLLCILIALGFLPSILFASGAFAFFYTFGNLLCLTSTLFLVGPAAQLKNMSKPERAIPSALFVGSMILTLLCVFFMPLAIFIIILVIVQTVSLAWYVVSYIPFAQSILGMVFSSFMKLFN